MSGTWFFTGQGGNGTSATTSTGVGWGPGTVRILIQAPTIVPPKSPDQVWIERTTGVIKPGRIDPRECAKVRKALETLGFGPEVGWNAVLGRRRFRVLARQTHPDAGGDEEAFKALSDAYDTLRRRGFVA